MRLNLKEREMNMLIATLLHTTLLLSAPGDTWLAGVAATDITPTQALWLSGYAGRDHGAEEVLHPLWVKALALQDAAGRQGVIITSDVLGFPKSTSDRIRDRLQQDHGLAAGSNHPQRLPHPFRTGHR